MKPYRILVKNYAQDALATRREDGSKVHDLVVAALTASEHDVELDFKGVKLIIASFLNTAIGELLKTYDRPTILQRLKLSNLKPNDLRLAHRVLEKAELNLQKTPEQLEEDNRILFE